MKQSVDLNTVFQNLHHIHFIGIGGVSMSALAEIMCARGYHVTGSDRSDSPTIAHLRSKGAEVFIGHAAANITGAGLIVYTAAIHPDNPELAAAAVQNIPAVERAVFLGYIMRDYRLPIGIAGTHGKTTTTSMISLVALSGGLDPTVLVGGTLPAIGGNYRIGGHDQMIFEACEYVDSFLNFCPKIAVLLNIEADHLDYFKDIEQIKRSFCAFAAKCGGDGRVIANFDDANVREVAASCECPVTSFALDHPADYTAVLDDGVGFPRFDAYEKGVLLGRVELSVPGRHNVLNALAAIAAGRALGLRFADIAAGLGSFVGVGRRFERKGERDGITVVDDYAHHPTEIAATLSAARSLGFGKVICIFQPHTYSRTRSLFSDFQRVLQAADLPILIDIYAAREKNDGSVTAEELANAIPGAKYAATFEEAAALARSAAHRGDIILTIGAGDVYKISELLLR